MTYPTNYTRQKVQNLVQERAPAGVRVEFHTNDNILEASFKNLDWTGTQWVRDLEAELLRWYDLEDCGLELEGSHGSLCVILK